MVYFATCLLSLLTTNPTLPEEPPPWRTPPATIPQPLAAPMVAVASLPTSVLGGSLHPPSNSPTVSPLLSRFQDCFFRFQI